MLIRWNLEVSTSVGISHRRRKEVLLRVRRTGTTVDTEAIVALLISSVLLLIVLPVQGSIGRRSRRVAQWSGRR